MRPSKTLLAKMKTFPPFYQAVWKACAEIPRGQVRTYGWIARRIGKPKAARAVGQALGKNPFAPVVPCHRVVGADGRLTGYSASGGVAQKRKMLIKEGAIICPPLNHATRAAAVVRKKPAGFTLLELMIVVAIIGILASIAIVRYKDLLRKANEGSLQGNLGTIRSAISIYYADMEGQYPDNLSVLTAGARFIKAIPEARPPDYHLPSAALAYGTTPNDAGGWTYDNVVADSRNGTVWVNCTHTDSKSTVWSAY